VGPPAWWDFAKNLNPPLKAFVLRVGAKSLGTVGYIVGYANCEGVERKRGGIVAIGVDL
jgi:hypothetical protein